MTAIAQPQTLGDLLKYEAPNLYSRETDTVAAGQKLTLGTVLGRDTTSSKLKAFDPDATDGNEIAIGVLAGDVDATLIDRDDALVIARHAIVARGALVWPTGITTAQKAAAIAQLTFLGVLVRDSA
ncbi:head decoration protein [Stenotrophomonas pavanii]|uniref:head decoration protein n=1 Tax=Gammaproteobacteria TaxID=1236 RepID=UPI00249F0B39|nr:MULTISPECIES: head decoration protein [Gammaproteobacteria]MDI4092149.1 head decoration protein [Pseudomonas aeruginosa]MDY1446142.1 head decoration protein [Pseudomonas aeruginosa]MDZ7476780.1 head decoration protein [Stenotrophomonas pavanii]